MPLTFETLEYHSFDELTPADAALLDSGSPWLAISHEKPQTMEEANELQAEISDKLELGDEIKRFDKPFTTGTAWHADGFYHKAIANLWSPYGRFGGVLYLANGFTRFGHPLAPTLSEQRLLDDVPELQRAKIIGHTIVKIPCGPGTTVIWREISATDELSDVAHASVADPGRTVAVTERFLHRSDET